MQLSNENFKNSEKIHSCNSSTESGRHEPSYESNSIYPELSYNSIYYEEEQLYSELRQPSTESYKSLKKSLMTPIQINEESTTSVDLPPISWNGYNSSPKILTVTNTGRTILINGQWLNYRPYINGGPFNGSYIFSQIHFHCPSEHEIDGKRYPLEMHVVHYKTSYLTQERAMAEKDGTVVLVYLFQMCDTDDTVLSSITKLAHLIEKANSHTELAGITLEQIIKPFTSNYYVYWGSVSTEKNSYLLQWIINCSELYVTEKEVEDFLKIMSSDESVNERQTPQMKPVNNAIFHVEAYSETPQESETTDSHDEAHHVHQDWPTCQCNHTCQSYNTCAAHGGEDYSKMPSSNLCPHRIQEKKDVQSQTSPCEEKTPNAASVSSDKCQMIKKPIPDSCETSEVTNGSCVNENSKLYVCEDDAKKTKKKFFNKTQKKSSCPSVPSCNKCSSVSKNSELYVCDDDAKNTKKKFFSKTQKKSSCPSVPSCTKCSSVKETSELYVCDDDAKKTKKKFSDKTQKVCSCPSVCSQTNCSSVKETSEVYVTEDGAKKTKKKFSDKTQKMCSCPTVCSDTNCSSVKETSELYVCDDDAKKTKKKFSGKAQKMCSCPSVCSDTNCSSVKETSELYVCEDDAKKSKKKFSDKTQKASSCPSVTSGTNCASVNSQLYICEDDDKRTKKKLCGKTQTMSSCPSATSTSEVSECNKQDNCMLEICESKTSSDHSVLKKSTCSVVCDSKEKIAKQNKRKSATGLQKKKGKDKKCKEAANAISKASLNDCKQKGKKKLKSSSFDLKQKEKNKKTNTESCESACVSSNSSLRENKQTKKKKQIKNVETCNSQLEVHSVVPLKCLENKCDTTSEIECKSPKEKRKKGKAEAKLSSDSIQSCKSVKVLKVKEKVKTEKIITSLACDDDIKTLFEKKRECSKFEPSGKDCTVNFLLTPGNLQSTPSCVLMTSESEGLEEKKTIENGESSRFHIADATVNTAIVSGLELPSDVEKERSKEFCLQTEHLFRTEKAGDFSECVNQEYNVAVIYNQNILQEFKGTFQPNKLELGSYEKLQLIPKYPEPDNMCVRLEDCIVKMESLDQFYIRAKFLLKKFDINDTDSKHMLQQKLTAPDFGQEDVINAIKCNKSTSAINLESLQAVEFKKQSKLDNQLLLKSAITEGQACKIKLLKNPNTDLEQNNKNISEAAEQATKSPNGKGTSAKDSAQKSDKSLKNLFYKRKKTVYFTYEKIEKDENSGKKIFVGSFRTKDEMKALSKEKRLSQNIEPLFKIEKSLENDRQKILLFPSKGSDFEEIVKIENPTEQEQESQSTSKGKGTDKQDNRKDLITLHKYRPKRFGENYPKDGNESLSFEEQEVHSETLLPAKKFISQRADVNSLVSIRKKSSSKKDSQVALIVIPVEVDNLSKIEVILVEHSENVKKKDSDKDKEYIPCLNCYN